MKTNNFFYTIVKHVLAAARSTLRFYKNASRKILTQVGLRKDEDDLVVLEVRDVTPAEVPVDVLISIAKKVVKHQRTHHGLEEYVEDIAKHYQTKDELIADSAKFGNDEAGRVVYEHVLRLV